MRINDSLDLTYCTNIHPADGWEAVFENIRRYAPALRERIAPGQPFGLGLRLSARDAHELLHGPRLPPRLDEFRAFLDAHGLYVSLINGFPYGAFHGTAVKAKVFAPDWREASRLAYTVDLVEILKALLPDGADGGISTIPLSYKPWIAHHADREWEHITHGLAQLAAVLVRVREAEGRFIHLDIEPEPDGLVETSAEMVSFFERWLLPVGGAMLASTLGISTAAARLHLRDHIQVCFDCCHAAVEYEDVGGALRRLADAGINVGRVQLSSALDVPLPADPVARAQLTHALAPFAESTYLHQVIERRSDGALCRFADLDRALATCATDASDHPCGRPRAGESSQWRIHFHVPLFTADYARFGSTQTHVRAALAEAIRAPFTRHLEIETYTWDVLPGDLKLDLMESIDREYRWVLTELSSERACVTAPTAHETLE